MWDRLINVERLGNPTAAAKLKSKNVESSIKAAKTVKCGWQWLGSAIVLNIEGEGVQVWPLIGTCWEYQKWYQDAH